MSVKSFAVEPFADVVARGRAMEERAPVTAEDLFLRLAEYAIQHEGYEPEQKMVLAIVDAATPHLTSGKTADWWAELLRALVGIERVENVGPNWDDEGVDYYAVRDEALDVLTGKR